MQFFLKGLAATWSAVVVFSCGDGSPDQDNVDIFPDETGVVTLALGDAPVDSLVAVNFTVTGVAFGGESGSTSSEAHDTFTFDSPKTFNLLDYQSGQNGQFYNLITSEDVLAGRYTWVRLLLDPDHPPEVVEKNTLQHHEIALPDNDMAELTLTTDSGLVVYAGEANRYAIDLDLHRSLHKNLNGNYVLQPVNRLIDLNDDNLYSISGSLNVSRPNGCTGSLYLFRGAVTPDDLDAGATTSRQPNDSVEPYLVNLIGDGQTYFEIDYLAPGSYTLAFTCDTEADDPDRDDDGIVEFAGTRVVRVEGDVSVSIE